MENMDKGLTEPKWVLINQQKYPKCQLSVQIVCPSPNVWDFDEKRLCWVSVVRDERHRLKELRPKLEGYYLSQRCLFKGKPNTFLSIFMRKVQGNSQSDCKLKPVHVHLIKKLPVL